MMSDKPEVIEVNYHNKKHMNDLLLVLNTYASEPAGGSQPLPEYTRLNLGKKLAEITGAVSFLVYIKNTPVALANCLPSFSTFSCKAILNIHDFAVMPAFRQQGLSQILLQQIEHYAVKKDFSKITLEVLSNNTPAKSAYNKYGFHAYELDSKFGNAEFWQKLL